MLFWHLKQEDHISFRLIRQIDVVPRFIPLEILVIIEVVGLIDHLFQVWDYLFLL